MKPFPVSAHAVTHQGGVRDHNEDAMFVSDQLFAVADGMGGHERGAWASATVVESLRAIILTGSLKKDSSAVSNAIYAANATIFSAGGSGSTQPGSTVAALLFADDRFAAFWAGDSRIYLKRGRSLVQLTRDHTHVQELVARGALTSAEATRHPLLHVLARVVGVEAKLNLDTVVGSAKPDDRYLLCSDGLTGTVKDSEIAQALDGSDTERIAQDLLDLALARGGPDNTTVIAVVCGRRPGLFSKDRRGLNRSAHDR